MGALKLHTEQNYTALKVVYGGQYEIKKVVQRWLRVDPMASEFPWQTPYSGMDNNPINFNDPTGMSAEDPFNKDIEDLYSKSNTGGQEIIYNAVFPDCPSDAKWDDARNSKDHFTYDPVIDDVVRTGYEVTVTGEDQSNNVVRNYGGDGSGSVTDNTMKVLDVVNDWNPLANVWDVISYSFTGKDRLGNKMTLTQANLKALGSLPFIRIGRISVPTQTFHRVIKPDILKAAGKGFEKIVGHNPDIFIEKGEIILKGTGSFKGKSFPTGLDPADFFD